MRFDLEVNITDVLTQTGKDKLASIVFPSAINGLTGRFNSMLVDYPAFIDTSRFNIINKYYNTLNISPLNFKSRVSSYGDVSLSKIIVKRGSIIPFFTPGTLIFHRYKLNYSNDSVRLLLDYDSDFDQYKIEIPDTADLGTISITTSRLFDGVADTGRVFKYIPESNINIVTNVGAPTTSYNRGTIIVSVNASGAPDGLYSSIYSLVPQQVCNSSKIKTGVFSTVKSTMQNDDVYINIDKSLIYIKKNGVFYNYRHKLLFNKSKEDHLYTLSYDENGKQYIYLNYSLELYKQPVTLTIPENKSRVIFFEKYPSTNTAIVINNDPGTVNLTRTSTMTLFRLTNTTISSISITGDLYYNVAPVITYRRYANYTNNIKHMKIDISPKSINFGDGVLCFSNAEVNKKTVPDSIVIDHGDNNILPMSSKPIKVRILNEDGIPLPNKNIKLTLTNNINGMIEWGVPSDLNNSIYGVTNLAGEFYTTIINSNLKVGHYIPKEWVGDITGHDGAGFTVTANTNNVMYIPSELTISGADKVFTFIITADDPLLGQIQSKGGVFGITEEFFTGAKPYDYYTDSQDVMTYEISGRKIAYVGIGADKQIGTTSKYTVKSTYIKPITMEIITAVKEFYGRKLFKFNQQLNYATNKVGFENILTNTSTKFTVVPASEFTIYSETTSGFNSKWLLTDNNFSYFKFTVPKYTKLTYANQLPGVTDKNVIGYYIRLQYDNLKPTIVAEHNDEFLGIILSTSATGMNLVAAPSNENTFTLSTEPGTINSYIGPYSYLTLSDYLGGQYGTNYATYVCKHSGRVSDQQSMNRCGHPNQITRTNYLPAPSVDSNLYCMHSTEYDRTHTPCPGLDCQLINPFLFYAN